MGSRRFRRGVTLEQHMDDHARHGDHQIVFENAPEKEILEDGQLIVLRGLGKIRWRDGNIIYEVTGTKVG